MDYFITYFYPNFDYDSRHYWSYDGNVVASISVKIFLYSEVELSAIDWLLIKGIKIGNVAQKVVQV
jgi:hypothetical protein